MFNDKTSIIYIFFFVKNTNLPLTQIFPQRLKKTRGNVTCQLKSKYTNNSHTLYYCILGKPLFDNASHTRKESHNQHTTMPVRNNQIVICDNATAQAWHTGMIGQPCFFHERDSLLEVHSGPLCW